MTEEKVENIEQNKKKSGVSRREFIAGTIGGAAALGAMTTLMPGVAAATPAAGRAAALSGTGVRAQATGQVPTTWSQTADVVVVGTGFAGLSAAITAYDAGASVLILEKLDQAYEGGSGRVSANQVYSPTNKTTMAPDPLNGAAYLQALGHGSVEDPDVYLAMAEGYVGNLAQIKALGGTLGTLTLTTSFTSAPGASSYQTYAIALPGAPAQSNGWPLGTSGDSRLWQLYRAGVASRNITVLYSTPATDLIQDPMTKEIKGVKALANNSIVLNIKANRAVILACGGVEFALDLQKQYYPFSPVYSTGSPGNTGDGVRMALKVGADLWHMNAVFPSYGAFIIPGSDPTVSGVVPVSVRGIAVNKLGNRFNMGTALNGPVGGFANELNVSFAFDPTTLDCDSIPCWAIFDDTARKTGPIMSTSQVPATTPGATGKTSWYVSVLGGTWSSDNSAEVTKGWILSANDLNSLAATIAADPDNGGKMTGAQLQATITAYNTDVANKADAQFLTNLSTASPINGPPYYAMKLWPNTSYAAPGPRRSQECQVLDPDQQPIPRLYSAGEMGAFFGWETNAGMHIGEAMWTGRTAGNNAAMETAWS